MGDTEEQGFKPFSRWEKVARFSAPDEGSTNLEKTLTRHAGLRSGVPPSPVGRGVQNQPNNSLASIENSGAT